MFHHLSLIGMEEDTDDGFAHVINDALTETKELFEQYEQANKLAKEQAEKKQVAERKQDDIIEMTNLVREVKEVRNKREGIENDLSNRVEPADFSDTVHGIKKCNEKFIYTSKETESVEKEIESLQKQRSEKIQEALSVAEQGKKFDVEFANEQKEIENLEKELEKRKSQLSESRGKREEGKQRRERLLKEASGEKKTIAELTEKLKAMHEADMKVTQSLGKEHSILSKRIAELEAKILDKSLHKKLGISFGSVEQFSKYIQSINFDAIHNALKASEAAECKAQMKRRAYFTAVISLKNQISEISVQCNALNDAGKGKG